MSGGVVGCGGEPSGETVFWNFSRAAGRLCRQRDPQVEAERLGVLRRWGAALCGPLSNVRG